MNLLQLKYAMRRLSLNQLRKLDTWLHDLIRKAEEAAQEEKSSSRQQTYGPNTLEAKTYRLESVQCGKENCKCARGKLHGPYWYSYGRVKGKVTSQYIGKNLPTKIEKRLKSRNEK